MFRSSQHTRKDTGSIFSPLKPCQRIQPSVTLGCCNSQPSPRQVPSPPLAQPHTKQLCHPHGLRAPAQGRGMKLEVQKALGESPGLFKQPTVWFQYIFWIHFRNLAGFFGVMYLLCISFQLETALNYPIQGSSYKALTCNYSLLSLEPEVLLSGFPERSSRYHGANHTFGSH